MDEIRPWLYIGDYNDTQNKNGLDFKSIQVVLQLAAAVKLPGINLLYVPVRDMAPIAAEHFKQGVEFVLAEKEKGAKILVACAAGVNRSSAFCIASLKEAEGLSLLEAFKEVKKNRRIAMPQAFVWQSLCHYYKEDVSYIELLRVAAEYY
jgi:protein-tyrosine phosphatase